jgi:hypothetical protein
MMEFFRDGIRHVACHARRAAPSGRSRLHGLGGRWGYPADAGSAPCWIPRGVRGAPGPWCLSGLEGRGGALSMYLMMRGMQRGREIE